MFTNAMKLAVVLATAGLGFGATTAKADHRVRSCGGGYASYAPSYYAPVYAPAPVVYAEPVVTYVQPASYYRPVTYVSRPVYYPPVQLRRSYYAPVRSYGGYYRPSGVGFSYGSRHRGFSFSIGD